MRYITTVEDAQDLPEKELVSFEKIPLPDPRFPDLEGLEAVHVPRELKLLVVRFDAGMIDEFLDRDGRLMRVYYAEDGPFKKEVRY